MKDARFTIPTPALLSKIASAGVNGQSRTQHPSALTDTTQRRHFHRSMFHGYDFDSTMLRIGSMNMLLHGIGSPDIRYRDSLPEGASEDAEK